MPDARFSDASLISFPAGFRILIVSAGFRRYWACSEAVEKAGCGGHSYPPAPAAECMSCAAKSAARPAMDFILETM